MEATAYDLSIQCCGKSMSNPARGITKSGYDLNGKSREQAMTISSNDLPLGTKVYLTFDDEQYNGVYTVRDTGNMQEGVFDLYVGDFGEKVSQTAIDFGRRTVEVKVMP